MSDKEIKASEWDNVTEPYTDIHRYDRLTEEPCELIASCSNEKYAEYILDQQRLIESQAKKIEIAVKAMEWYASEKNWRLGVRISMGSAFPLHEAIKSDKGDRARTALSEIKRLSGGKS